MHLVVDFFMDKDALASYGASDEGTAKNSIH